MPNPKMIYHLRNTPHPIPADVLVTLYDDSARLEDDIQHLARFGLIQERPDGYVWRGS